jgi:proteasome activator subunit 4
MEGLIANKDQDKQRAAAEFIAGVVGGTQIIPTRRSTVDPTEQPGAKHWPTSKQQKLWEWFDPFMEQIFVQNIKTDTLMIWTSFLEVSGAAAMVGTFKFLPDTM